MQSGATADEPLDEARQRLRDTLAAAEQERRRWARELHDETLQGLGGLQVLLSSAPRRRAGGAERTGHRHDGPCVAAQRRGRRRYAATLSSTGSPAKMQASAPTLDASASASRAASRCRPCTSRVSVSRPGLAIAPSSRLPM